MMRNNRTCPARGRAVFPRTGACRFLLWLWLFAAPAAASAFPADTLPRLQIRGGAWVTPEGLPFRIWGFNCGGADSGLLEDGWEQESVMAALLGNFREMRALGANTVRIHLQFGRFMKGPREPNDSAFRRLDQLLSFAAGQGLYVDITGLGAYRQGDSPAWYDAMDEEARWAAQAAFWRRVAMTAAGRAAVLCYDLMNEPVAGVRGEQGWLPGKGFGGYHYVQNITRDLRGRDQVQVMAAWIDTLTRAIREVDPHTPVTVGFLPFPSLAALAPHLDFLSLHLYPKAGKMEEAARTLQAFRTGKPLLIEETYPLSCSGEELEAFIRAHDACVAGWLSHYMGRTIAELTPPRTMVEALHKSWMLRFRDLSAAMRRGPGQPCRPQP